MYVTSGGTSYSTGASALFDRLYINDGAGNFTKDTAFASPGGFATNSTVTAADFTGDGATDLFVGERLEPFAVGVAAKGFFLINDGDENFHDSSSEWSSEFENLGMVTDSKSIDWDGDGLQDLIVVGEWMTPRMFRNTGSSFEEITEELNFSDKRGLWNIVHTDDIDGDGRKDLVLGNHGLNSRFNTTANNSLKMWISDFENDGISDQFISRSIDGNDYPFVLKHDLLEQIPSLRDKYPSYESYSDQTVQQIFSDEQLSEARILQADILESVVIYNKETGPEITKLPLRTQFAPVFGIWSGNLSKSDQKDLLTVGNLYEVKPMAGPYDASYGTVITPDLKSIPASLSGFSIQGSGRNIITVQNSHGEKIIIVARNNDSPVFYKVNEK